MSAFSEHRRVWVKSFYGFSPEHSGYLGFTDLGDRSRLLDLAQDGDLVLIYGASDKETAKEDVHIALGFLELSLEAVEDVARMSDEYKANRLQKNQQNKWTYGIRVTRAWRIIRNNYKIQHITKETFAENFPPHFAKRGVLISEIERDRALSLPVIEISVFGEPPPSNIAARPFPIKELLKPSHGISPSFGSQTIIRNDGEHFLYMLKANGCIWHLLGMSLEDFKGKAVVKVGYTNDPKRRCDEHNASTPARFDLKWEIVEISRPFMDGQSAKDAEDILKFETFKNFESLGGEYYFGDYNLMRKYFRNSKNIAFYFKGAAV